MKLSGTKLSGTKLSGCPFSGRSTVAPLPPASAPTTGPTAAGLALATAVTAQVRRHGRHFLPPSRLVELAGVRDDDAAGDSYLAAFLDGVLAEYDGRFHNRTYLALPLLELLVPTIGAEEMATLLIADVVRHELATEDESLDPRARRLRLKHARRFVGAEAPSLDGPTAAWFDLTALPVSQLHDEYFFVRTLQAHEMVFTVLAGDVRAATAALRAGSVAEGIAHLDHATALLGRAVLLFRMVATMRGTTFSAFREFTQGASAIQSEQYKRFELACGTPTAPRLLSDAFGSVPAVLADPYADDLTSVYLDALYDGLFTPAEWAMLDERLHGLEMQHQRWKAAHLGLATRMLGDGRGSGYTSGVPYLRGCLENRLFRQLDLAPAPELGAVAGF